MFGELLKTYCAGESVSSRVGQIRRRTLGTCPAFANPSLPTSPARDGFEKFPVWQSVQQAGVFRAFCLKVRAQKRLLQSLVVTLAARVCPRACGRHRE